MHRLWAWMFVAGMQSTCGGDGGVVDGEVGSTVLRIDNQTADALTVVYTAGPIVDPDVLAATLPAQETTAAFASSGCFGCWDRPADLLATLELQDPTGAVVASYDPVDNEDWVLEQTGEYDAVYTLTVADP